MYGQLMMLYRIGEFSGTTDFLLQIAEKQGKVKKGGVLDLQKAARTVLEDWNSGRIPYYTVPPADEEKGVHVGAEVVSAWSAAFDIDSLLARETAEIEVLDAPSADTLVEMQSAGPDTGELTMGSDGEDDDGNPAPL